MKSMAEAEGSLHPSYDELLARRGSPWTFDAESLVTALTSAKRDACGILPTYSRTLSDPVPGGVELLKTHRIVLVEGNYLFNFGEERWSGLAPLFDIKWFVRCQDMTVQRERLIKRHLETWTAEKDRMWGPGELGAAKKADANDVLNAAFVDDHKIHADLIITSI
jgi:pantothenate kinase